MKPIGFRRTNPNSERIGEKREEIENGTGKERKEWIRGDEGGLKGEGEVVMEREREREVEGFVINQKIDGSCFKRIKSVRRFRIKKRDDQRTIQGRSRDVAVEEANTRASNTREDEEIKPAWDNVAFRNYR